MYTLVRNCVLRDASRVRKYISDMLELIPFSLLVFYLVPFFVAVARGHDGAMMILAANLLTGWTVLGWFAVFAVALATPAEGLGAASKRQR